MHKVFVTSGVYWVEIPQADLRILCGCPADSVKHLMKRGLTVPAEIGGKFYETGPNAILLSDELLQGGSFCNLSEFPVLQMLYRQGMILPGHPNNTGIKPLLIGNREQVDAQMRYIQRGNYGLFDLEELKAAGLDDKAAREQLRIKLKFAFGAIRSPSEVLDSVIVDETATPVEIRNGVTVERIAPNHFVFRHGDRSTEVDLSLPPLATYESPYPLDYHNVQREYFAVIHSGDGDGWDPNRPSMGSILMYQGRLFLIDTGPNITNTLNFLGIGVNEIEGVFHTHCHDDHFAGLTELFRSDHRIKYYATKLVRHSVSMKLSSLLGVHEDRMTEFFDVVDLEPDVWNRVDGLEVMPRYSPHPVETNIYYFRAHWGGGYRTYAHLADICSMSVLDGMTTTDKAAPGIDKKGAAAVREAYFQEATVKKIDIGGGMIHGSAADFVDDPSGKIILSHTARPLTDKEKAIGSGAPFGTVEVLIPSNQDYVWRYTAALLRSYFPNVPDHEMRMLMNNPLVTFNPQSTLLRQETVPKHVHFVITGNVEVINIEAELHGVLSSGALIGEMTGLFGLPSPETYHAASFVRTVEIPTDLYLEFVRRNELFGEISRLLEYREFLHRTWLCGEIVVTTTLNGIAKSMKVQRYAAGQTIDPLDFDGLFIGFVKKGRVRRVAAQGDGPARELEILKPGDFFGEETSVFWTTYGDALETLEETEVYYATPAVLAAVPRVRWRLFETYQRRKAFQM